MSTYLNEYNDSIPLGYTILQTQNEIVGRLTANGWQLIAQSDGAWSDVIPPTTETIGTSKFREVVRIYFTGTSITVGSYQVCIADAFPQAISIMAKTTGAVACAVTIDGVTVTGADIQWPAITATVDMLTAHLFGSGDVNPSGSSGGWFPVEPVLP